MSNQINWRSVNIYYTGVGHNKAEPVYSGVEFLRIMNSVFPNESKSIAEWVIESGAMILLAPEAFIELIDNECRHECDCDY
jgi:hypothetical protein